MADAIFNAGWDNTLPTITTMSGAAEVPIEVSVALTTVTMTSFSGSVTTVNGTRCLIAAQHRLAVRITPMVGADTLFAANPDPVDAASSGEFDTSEVGVE